MLEPTGWWETLSGGAVTTLIRPALANRQHIIYGFSVSVGPGGGGGVTTIQVRDNTTVIWRGRLTGGNGSFRDVVFLRGLTITRGNACSVVASKTGGTLEVNLHGITRG